MITKTLVNYGLKITPQRIAVLEAMHTINGHPTAEHIMEYVREKNPNIAVGTIYNILETFIEKGLVSKVKTDRDAMQYELTSAMHHHLYSQTSDRVEDYYDEELNAMLLDFFARKQIPNFTVQDIRLQLMGKFKDELDKTT